jgi:DNA polymerase III subunit epsilon
LKILRIQKTHNFHTFKNLFNIEIILSLQNFKIYILNLTLTKPIIFFDLETTGVNIATDRIVEISILKVFPNGNKESKTWLVNPEIEIPAEATAVHGITNEKVVMEPTFKELAPKINELIADCDLAGFNSNRFDIPLLAEELMRAGIDFDMNNRKAIDVQVIFHKKEQRTLSAGYQFYCGKNLENAHSAEADTNATYEILLAQLKKYDDIGNTVDSLSEFSSHRDRADFAGFVLYNEQGNEIFSFGKYKGRTVEEVLIENPGYFAWMQNADFPLYTKKVLREIKERMSNPKKVLTDEEKLKALQQKFNLR